jgi:hypothetical protein
MNILLLREVEKMSFDLGPIRRDLVGINRYYSNYQTAHVLKSRFANTHWNRLVEVKSLY